MHEEVSKNNIANRTCAKKWHYVKNNVLPLNITIGGYVMKSTYAKHVNNLQSKKRGRMFVKEAK